MDYDMSAHVRVASGANALLGLWLIISPWVFNYADASVGSAWSSVIVGASVAVLGALRYRRPHHHAGRSWLNLVLGAWTALSAWIFGYFQNDARIANSLIVGLAIIALAIWSGSATMAEGPRERA